MMQDNTIHFQLLLLPHTGRSCSSPMFQELWCAQVGTGLLCDRSASIVDLVLTGADRQG